MHFSNMIVGLNGAMQGSGQDQIGMFTITGQVTSHGTVQFNKSYRDYTVKYQGIVNNGTITGHWQLDHQRDTFMMEMEKIEWNGHMISNGQRFNLSLDIHVDTNGVFGLDKDNEGAFVVRGVYSNQDYSLLFTRQYINSKIQYFRGDMTNDGQYWIVRGEWQMAGGSGGEHFEMYRPAPDADKFKQMQETQRMNWTPPPVMPQPVQPMIMQPGMIPPQPMVIQQPVVIQQ